MALTDPRSVIREILSRRPDLHAAFAPQLQAMGVQVAGPGGFPLPRVPPAGGSYTGLMSAEDLGPLVKYAGRTPAALPTGLSPDEMALPFNGTGGAPNSLRSMADRGDPSQAPDFRSRLYAASQTAGSARVPPGSGLMSAGTNPTAQVQGQLPANFMNPSNLPRTRPPQELSAAGPPSPLTGASPPSPLAGAGPPAPIIGREAPPGLNGPLSPLASRFGDQSQLSGGAFSGSFPRPPQPRPFESTIAARPMPPGGPGSLPAAPLLAGKPFPSAPGMTSRFGDQSQLASGAFSGGSVGPPPPMAGGPTPQQLAAARDQVQQIAALRSAGSLTPASPPSPFAPLETTPTSTMSNPLQRAPLNLAAGVGATALPLGSTTMPFAAIPPTPASVAQRTEDTLGPLPPGVGTGAPVRSAQVPLIAQPPSAGTVPPVGSVTSQDLPAPPPVGAPPSLASVGPPNPARMEVVANYNQPPPGMTLPPGVTQQDVGRLGFGATDIDPSKAPVHRTGSNTGKYAGAALGALKGLAGGPVGAAVGAALGYQGGKRVGGLADRDFGLGARFTNRNYGQGVVANPPAIMDMGVPAITPPAQTPILQAGTGGIFGQGRSMLGGAAQKILSAVRSGKMPLEAGAKALGMDVGSLRDSLGSMGSAGRGGMGGMGGMGGGGYGYSGGGGSGGQYGGGGGYNIRESIGGAYRNR